MPEQIYARVMRRDLAAPGYALIVLRGASAPASFPASRCSVPRPPLGASAFETPDRVESLSLTLRAAMLGLKETLSAIHLAWTGQRLGYLSLARFDQQVTTRLHVDGAPPESYLMLGYEPSEVESALTLADLTRAAHAHSITPEELLRGLSTDRMGWERRLRPYIIPLRAGEARIPRILVLNNSTLPYGADNSQGMLHQATIRRSPPGARRIVNSILLVPIPPGDSEPAGTDLCDWFRTTTARPG